MVKPFKLSWPVGHSDSMNKEDIENTKQALEALGLYEPPQLFTERFSTEPMIQGLKKFQRQEGLEPDGIMNPDGPTHRRMNGILDQSSEPENSRETSIPKSLIPADRPNLIPHSTAIRLYFPVGHRRENHPHDIVSVKRGLAMLGNFSMYKSTLNDTQVDGEFLESLRRFQKHSDVKVDGWMGPKGETENALEARIQALAKIEDSDRERGELGDKSNDTVETAAAPIPAIVYKMAEVFGMAVMAAWAWWQSMSKGRQEEIRDVINGFTTDGDIEDRCDYLHYKVDIPICNEISERYGKQTAEHCFRSANERYAACIKGTPIDELPPLERWEN